MKRVTVKDIAVATGLSVNSVSHALADKLDISEKTKQLVRQKAEEMGYVKNMIASSLRSKVTKTITVLYDFLMNPYYSIMTAFLERELAAHGYRIMIFTESGRGEGAYLTEKVFKSIMSHNTDGIISFMQADAAVEKLLAANGTKIVILGRESKHLDCVFSDDVKGSYTVTKHLLEKGHRKILILCSHPEVSCGIRRLEGYTKALEEASVPIDEGLIYFWGNDYYSVETAVEKCAAKGKSFSAVVCFNDHIAFEAVNYFESLGIRIPEDVAVTGYDNIQSEFSFFKQITTIDTNKEIMVKTAVDILLKSIHMGTGVTAKKINDIKFVKGYTT